MMNAPEKEKERIEGVVTPHLGSRVYTF